MSSSKLMLKTIFTFTREWGQPVMSVFRSPSLIRVIAVAAFLAAGAAGGQAGDLPRLSGTVSDPSGAVIPGATVTIHGPNASDIRSTQTSASGEFEILLAPGRYRIEVSAAGF